MNRNKIISRIQKLMALADDQEGTPEGEAAAKAADKLMREHAVSMATIHIEEEEPVEHRRDIRIGHSNWKRELWLGIGYHCNCRPYWFLRSSTGGIFGKAHDVEVAFYLYETCLKQIDTEAREYLKRLPGWYTRGEKKREGNSFRRSAVRGLRDKLYQIRQDARQDDAAGTALVLKRGQEAADAYKAMGWGTGRHQDPGYGWNKAGYQAGKRVRLRAGVGSNSLRQLGGER